MHTFCANSNCLLSCVCCRCTAASGITSRWFSPPPFEKLSPPPDSIVDLSRGGLRACLGMIYGSLGVDFSIARCPAMEKRGRARDRVGFVPRV